MPSAVKGALLTLTLAACDAGGQGYTPENPPPHVVQVLVTTDVDAEGSRVRSPLGDDDVVAATTTSIGIVFDRYLDPRSTIRQSYCLHSDTAPVATLSECVQAISTVPTYDPVTRTVTLYLDEALAPDTSYSLVIFAAARNLDFGFRAFDDVALEETITFSLSTLAENPTGLDQLESPADLDEGIVSCDDARTLFAGCTTCHSDVELIDGAFVANAPMGLSFEPNGLPLAIDRVAHQTALADQGAEAATRPARFGAGMPVIQRSNPGNSYAIYKVLARARYYGDTMTEGELERLQSWIVGAPMPSHEVKIVENPDDPDGPPIEASAAITQGALRRISNWIAAGASCEGPTAAP